MEKVFIIAEIGINHNGEVELAKKAIDLVKQAGADCIKFQTFKPEEFISDPKVTWTYKSQGKEVTESQLTMFQRAVFSPEEWAEIIAYCKKQGVLFATTPQNPSDLDLILGLTDLPFIKVGSDDLTNVPLLRYYVKRGKPMIISTGMSYEEEIADAVKTLKESGVQDLTVLHCVSLYPTEPADLHLSKMLAIRDKFDLKVGFSDHTAGHEAALAATALGARVIEKHFTLSHDLPGPDHWFSEDDLVGYVAGIRKVEQMMGSPKLVPVEKEMQLRDECRRSIIAKQPIKSGQVIGIDDLEFKRPGTGISPRFIDKVVGITASRDYQPGELIEEKV